MAGDHLLAIAAMRERGVEPPASFVEKANPPVVPSWMSWVWDGFLELNRSRTSNGFGVNPIAFSEKVAWSEAMGLDGDDRWFFLQVIGELDEIFVAEISKPEPGKDIETFDEENVRKA